MKLHYCANKKVVAGINIILLVVIIIVLALITTLSDLSLSTLGIIYLVTFVVVALLIYTFQFIIGHKNIEQEALIVDNSF